MTQEIRSTTSSPPCELASFPAEAQAASPTIGADDAGLIRAFPAIVRRALGAPDFTAAELADIRDRALLLVQIRASETSILEREALFALALAADNLDARLARRALEEVGAKPQRTPEGGDAL